MESALQQHLRTRPLLRVVFALVSGAALALSFPTTSFVILAFFALAPLLCAVVSAPRWSSALGLGWLALTLTWLINVPWVVAVMELHGGIPFAIGVFFYVTLAVVLGFYGGLFTLLVYWVRPGARFLPWLLIPVAWAAVEYGRSHLLGGFPWHLLAVAVIDLPFVQIARFIGPYALGSLILVPSVVLAWNVLQSWPRQRPILSIAAIGIYLIVWGGLGGLLMVRERERMEGEPKIPVALVQPNISQSMRWDHDLLFDIFARMIGMTEEAVEAGAKVIVWPESTVPQVFATTDFYRETIEQISGGAGVDIILGSVAEDPDDPSSLWNSAYVVSDGEIRGRYDKLRLVPFGEYVPLRKVLFFAEKLVHEVGDFRFGTNDEPLQGVWRYGPAICYEVVYPAIPAQQVRNGAELLVTITNDGWFGRTAAPWQHLHQARLRAVETNRYLLRAATTGVSALVDPTGRIVDSLGMEQQGVILGSAAARTGKSVYVRFGDWFAAGSVIAVLAAIAWRRKGER